MDRRNFIQTLSAAAVATTALAACHNISKDQNTDTETSSLDGNGDMTYRLNPNTNDRVSLLGFGMMRLPVLAGGSGRENPDSEIDQELVNQQVDYALKHGVNYFDTSPAYCQGRSETATGIALSRHARSSYFIATKLSNFSPETWSREESQQMFERSLRYLQTDYIDYLLLHGIGMSAQGYDAIESFNHRYIGNGILDWLVEQKQKGRIRNLGFSYHGDIRIFDMLLEWHDKGLYHWDFVQIELNYLDWSFADEINPRNTNASYLYEELSKRHIPVVIMEPLLGGRLASVPQYVEQQMRKREPNSPAARWAFRYAGTPEGILTVLSGMTYTAHLQQNIETYSPLRPISEEENRFLMNIAEQIMNLRQVPCTGCSYCMPCPYGINIPAIFAHYNQSLSEGLVSTATHLTDSKAKEEYRKNRRQYLISYKRTIPAERRADHCIGCSQCVEHCPQNILIPQELHKIDQYIG